MFNYILRRIALIPLTLLGIITLNFLIVQFAPGGPVERVIAQIKGINTGGSLGPAAEVARALDARAEGNR